MIVEAVVLVGSTMIAADGEGVVVRNGDGDSVVGTDEVQATRISRINNQKNERIKQTSSSRHSVRGPPTRVVRASRAIAPQRTLRWVRGPPARVVQVAAGTDHFPRSPTHFYPLSPHPTALAHRLVAPSTRAQRRYYYPQHHQYPAD